MPPPARIAQLGRRKVLARATRGRPHRGLGYGIRAIEDHGWKAAALRAEGMLQANSALAPPGEYQTIPIETIAAGRSRATYAAVVGDVTQVSHELGAEDWPY